MNTLLITENNKDFAYVIHWFFTNKGFKVFSTTNGEESLKIFEKEKPDVILLDIGLDGDMDGREVAKRIRSLDKDTPILFMSGESNSPEDVVKAFGAGGNFFMKKPVSLEELEVHIMAALKSRNPSLLFEFGSVVFNPEERQITIDGKSESLTEKETQVLQILSENIASTVKSVDILNTVWGDDDKEESLRNTISALRKKIESTEVSIETIKNKGYRLYLIH